MNFAKHISVLLCSALFMILLAGCATSTPDTHVYLVRHAEKVVGPNVGSDPNLTQDGDARAQLLADMLADKNIQRIHSSDYIRTRNTAQPLADLLGLDIELYDPRQLDALATKIVTAGGSHLVVGHSNTIPETVVALKGEGGSPIEEKSEYNRLYKVVISDEGNVQTELTRYGKKQIRPAIETN